MVKIYNAAAIAVKEMNHSGTMVQQYQRSNQQPAVELSLFMDSRVQVPTTFASIISAVPGLRNPYWGSVAVSYTHLTLPTTPYV